jgi:deoxyadenosine/deoxycytidine kinase
MSTELTHNFLVIEGNIGAGKTTLATKLAADLNTRLLLEQFADNPFLPKFYIEPEKHAFPLELSFLAERYSQLKEELVKQDLFKPKIVSDYYFLKCLIFAKANLKEDEYDLYSKLFHIINHSLPKPDLFVFLYHPIEKLQKNIQKRGRSYEQSISNHYLEKVQSTYFDFLKQMNDLSVLVIDVNENNFVEYSADYEKVLKAINKPYPVGITRIKMD